MQKKTNGARASVVPASGTPAVDASPLPVTIASSTTEANAVNFLALAKDKPLIETATTGPVTHYQNSDMASMPGGPQSCYLPYPLAPNHTPNSPGDWTIPGTHDPNKIGDWTIPLVPSGPSIPIVSSTYTFSQYWGVQKKKEREKGGPEYWVVNPLTLPYIESLGTALTVARCLSENDAEYICRLLNKDYDGLQKAVPEKTCTCNGINEECHLCPPRPKNVPGQISYGHAKDTLKSLEGRVLTVVDAAIENESRNKALKTLFKREFRKTITGFYEFCHRHIEGDHYDSDGGDDIG